MFRFLLSLLLLCAAGEARAEWHRADTRHFSLQADLPEAEIRQLAREIEALDAVLVTMTGAADAGHGRKLDMLVLDDIATVRRLASIDSLTDAIFFNNAIDQAAVLARGDRRDTLGYDLRDALFHEYCHYFLRRHVRGLHPSWFNEGFASLFETARMTDDTHMRVGAIPRIALWLDPDALPSFTTIAGVENAMNMTADRDKLYAQGWLVTHHYLFGGKRAAEIARYLDLVRAGKPLGKPEVQFAGGYRALDADIAAYASAILPEQRSIAVPPVAEGAIAVRALRPGEVALVERRVDDSDLSGEWAGDEEIFLPAYSAASAKLAKWPDDPALGLYTAKLAFLADRALRATELIEALSAKNPGDLDIRALRGRILVSAAHSGSKTAAPATLSESRALLLGVLASDPFHVDALAGMNENLTEARGANAEAIGYLRRAIEVEPANASLRYRAVEQMLRIRDFTGAIAMLQPVANQPHDGQGRKFAVELIAEIKRRTGAR